MSAILALFNFTLWQTLRDLKFWLMVAMLFLPCALVAVVRGFAPPMSAEKAWSLYNGLIHFIFILILIPLACMIHGTGLIGSEVESRTITFLISRKLKRRTVLATRFAAVLAVLTLTCWIALLALHMSVIGGQEWAQSMLGEANSWNFGRELSIYLIVIPIGVAAFFSIFTLLGIMATKPLAWSLVYFVMVELVIANIPADVSSYSVVRQIRGWVVSRIPELTEINPQVFVADPSGAWKLPLIAAGGLLLACIWIGQRELVPQKIARD